MGHTGADANELTNSRSECISRQGIGGDPLGITFCNAALEIEIIALQAVIFLLRILQKLGLIHVFPSQAIVFFPQAIGFFDAQAPGFSKSFKLCLLSRNGFLFLGQIGGDF